MEEPEQKQGIKSHYNLEYLLVQAAADARLRDLARITGERLSLNCRDAYGFTALHRACENGHYDIVKFLLANRAQVNVVNSDLTTPLHLAAANGHIRCCQILILAGANVLATTKSGCQPRDFCKPESDIWWVFTRYIEDGLLPDPVTFPGPSGLPFVPKWALPQKPSTPEKEKKSNKNKNKNQEKDKKKKKKKKK